MGFSDGGVIAYKLAIKKPSLISKLITIGADCNPPGKNLQKLFSNIIAKSWQKRFPETFELYQQLNPEANFNLLMKYIISMWLDVSATGYPAEQLKKIQCDTLVIRGDNDHLMPRSSILHLNEYLPDAKLLNVPFAGHAAHNDQCEVVSMIVNQFLQQ